MAIFAWRSFSQGSGQAFAEAISRLPNQEIASLRNARKDSKNYVFGLFCPIRLNLNAKCGLSIQKASQTQTPAPAIQE